MHAAILVAGGQGERLGADRPKALVQVAGVPLVRAGFERLAAAGLTRIVVAAPEAHLQAVRSILPPTPGIRVTVVAGGATRTESVSRALGILVADEPVPVLVAVHDAARGFAPISLIQATVDAVRGDVVAAAPGLPVTDTVKRATDDGVILETIDRTGLVGIQTPQVFRLEVLVAAHAGGRVATDDLALVEGFLADGDMQGRAVITVGHPLAGKITYPEDVAVLEALLGWAA